MKVDIRELTGNAKTDRNAALKMLRERHQHAGPVRLHWHPVEDWTMMPVPTALNSTFSHTGGNSIVNNELF